MKASASFHGPAQSGVGCAWLPWLDASEHIPLPEVLIWEGFAELAAAEAAVGRLRAIEENL